ncbi:hypothetical protein CCR94_15780 [Rhodoblastus sphagnicola]|uniref:Uncharacterized protein n=2 Tax=Rhodoblastus sphagnicola TaxID=333368 RepID=A0A2S6N3S0_9HYPH|nr:hypothetical protein CCR94_15780 [Rhodoblastus sphagnicola]
MVLCVACGLASAMFAATGLIFCAISAYLSLSPHLEPHWAAFVLAALLGLIGRIIVWNSVQRLTAWVKSSAPIALAPHILGFAVRHAKLIGLVSAAGAAFFAARSKRAS